MIIKNTKNNSGFVALISAIIISVILLLMITNSSLSGFYSRFDISDSEYKDRSSALADACADTAILNLAEGTTTTGNIAVGTDNCTIVSYSSSGAQTTILTQGVFQNSFTNLKIVVDSTSFAVISWQEI